MGKKVLGGIIMKIREMRPEDWNDVRRIYLEGIATGIATFQQSAPEYEDWDRGHLADCRLVAEEEGHIPVSYTHLDVYKRQAHWGASHSAVRRHGGGDPGDSLGRCVPD